MKKTTWIVILAAGIALVGCNKEKLQQLEQQNTSLQAEKHLQDSLLNDFMATFNEFEENLDLIKEKEQLISMQTGEENMRKEAKDQVIEDIQMINDLLDQNRLMIEELTAQAESSELKAKDLSRMVSRMKKQLASRDQEIGTLKEQLTNMEFTVENLNGRLDTLNVQSATLARLTEEQSERLLQQQDQIEEQAETMKSQETRMNTAYFVTGSPKELKAADIIVKKRVNKDLNENAFTQIDIREVNSIPIETKKAQLLTTHPSDSYVFLDEDEDKKYDKLEITDPERFWQASRYLVVMTN
ncbi:MAG: hypothetical protein AAF587_31120 [Bacteroidota bacterium]